MLIDVIVLEYYDFHLIGQTEDQAGNYLQQSGNSNPSTMVRERMINKMNSLDGATPMSFLPLSQEEYEYVCDTAPGNGNERKAGWDLLTNTIKIHSPNSITKQRKTPPPRILCSIYANEDEYHKIEGIIESWGWRCDGFLAASTFTNETVGAFNLMNDNEWETSRSIWTYIHDNYLEDYDFFWLGGDDVYMIVENMREYLWNLTETIGQNRFDNEPLYLGNRMECNKNCYFAGADYVLNRLAVKRMVTESFPTFDTKGEIRIDRLISMCLRDIGITLNDTIDDEGKQIFFLMDPDFIANYGGTDGYFKATYSLWGKLYGYKAGKEIVSRGGAIFRNIRYPTFMKRLHAILYKTCPPMTPVGNGLAMKFAIKEFFENKSVHEILNLNLSHIGLSPQDVEDFVQPHVGARFPNGTLGYVAPLTSVRERMMKEMNSLDGATPMSFLPMSLEEFEYVCDKEPSKGFEKDGGWDLLTNTINVESEISNGKQRKTPPPRILCSIYTYEGNHYRVEGIIESWGWRCDGFLAASTFTNETIGAVNLTHLGSESYLNMWQKTRSIWAYIHDNYLEDYDFFWLGGDDVHMIVENMREYLWNLTETIGHDRLSNEPLYLGHRIRFFQGCYFGGGGGGYTMNQLAVKRLVTEALATHQPEEELSHEDRLVGGSLIKIGITLNDTVDEEGRQLFHIMDPDFIAKYDGTGGYFEKVYSVWAEFYGNKTGKDVVSNRSITLHNLKNPSFVKRIHAILYKACPQGTALGDALALTNVSKPI